MVYERVHRLARVRLGFRFVTSLAAVGVIAVGPTEAFEAELARYYEALRPVCVRGVTPEMTAAWEAAWQAVERGRAAGRYTGNFAGLRTPEQAWLDCLQSPGDGKT